MTPRERIARIVDPLAFEDDTGASIGARDVAREFREAAINKADRILAAFPEIAGEMGYVKGGSVTLKNDDQLTGRGADIVRDWRPTINGDTTGD
jgi:hypothetical protein